MNLISPIGRFLSNLWGPPGLTPELRAYCAREGLDAWQLLDDLRRAREAEKPAKAPLRTASASLPARNDGCGDELPHGAA